MRDSWDCWPAVIIWHVGHLAGPHVASQASATDSRLSVCAAAVLSPAHPHPTAPACCLPAAEEPHWPEGAHDHPHRQGLPLTQPHAAQGAAAVRKRPPLPQVGVCMYACKYGPAVCRQAGRRGGRQPGSCRLQPAGTHMSPASRRYHTLLPHAQLPTSALPAMHCPLACTARTAASRGTRRGTRASIWLPSGRTQRGSTRGWSTRWCPGWWSRLRCGGRG